MPLLVLAQTPPPVHGQSLMVKTLVEGLAKQFPQVEICHVDLKLSTSAQAIGRWRFGKWFALRRASKQAEAVLREKGPLPLYYVPAPGKGIAALRDMLLLPRLRKLSGPLILHWHAGGLSDWSRRHPWSRPWLRRALGQAALSIIPSECLREEVALWNPARIAVVPNGLDVSSPLRPHRPVEGCIRVLYLGLCEETKGIFVLLKALLRLDAQGHRHFHLQIAGDFAREEDRQRFRKASRSLGPRIQMLGFVSGEAKTRIMADSDIVCLPTFYPYEVQPLVALEALAADKKVVATRWRGLPELLAGTCHELAEPQDPKSLAEALLRASQAPLPEGLNVAKYRQNFTQEAHLRALHNELSGLL